MNEKTKAELKRMADEREAQARKDRERREADERKRQQDATDAQNMMTVMICCMM